MLFLLTVPPEIDKLKFPTIITPMGPETFNNLPYTHIQTNRTKRQVSLTSSKIEPELLLFCDNAMVQQFEGDTDELLEYLLHFWHAVSIHPGVIFSHIKCYVPLLVKLYFCHLFAVMFVNFLQRN